MGSLIASPLDNGTLMSLFRNLLAASTAFLALAASVRPANAAPAPPPPQGVGGPYLLFANNVPPATDWINTQLAAGAPVGFACTGSPASWARCANNSTSYLVATSFDASAIPANEVVVEVRADVMCKYNNGETGRWRFQMLVNGSTVQTEDSICEVSGPNGNCRFRFDDILPTGRDVTNSLRLANGRIDLARVGMRARRFNPGCANVPGAKVKAFRLWVRTEADCNMNGIADPLEIPANDCNNNSMLDICEIAANPALDCNNNMVIDSCELIMNPLIDCDNNGMIDECEIASNPTLDCNNNGTLDDCEISANPTIDCDDNGEIDACEIAANSTLDCNMDGILDDCQTLNGPFCVSLPNSFRVSGGKIEVLGIPTVGTSANPGTIRLRAYDTPPDQFGLFICAQDPNAAQPNLGNGVLCLGTPLSRIFPIVQADTNGISTSTIPVAGNAQLFNSALGSTLYFQHWHRDTAAGGAFFNLTNGVMVTFCN